MTTIAVFNQIMTVAAGAILFLGIASFTYQGLNQRRYF